MDLAISTAVLSSLTTFTPSDSFMSLDVVTSYRKKMELRDQTPKMTTKHWHKRGKKSKSKRLSTLMKMLQSLKRILLSQPSLLNLLSKKKKLKRARAAYLSTSKSVTRLTEIKPMPSLGS